MKTIKGYKFVDENLNSHRGNHHWEIGKWYKQEGIIELCNNGFHACEEPIDSLSYFQFNDDRWFVIEARGEIIKDEDKFVALEMRLVKEIKNVNLISAKIAIYAAEQVLPYFEKRYPDDTRPHEAILAAKRYMKDKNEANKEALVKTKNNAYDAVYAAHAFYCAAIDVAYVAAVDADDYAAARAVYAAAMAAYYAAGAAYAASRAAYAAVNAVDAAADAARVAYAANAAYAAMIKKKINAKLLRLIKEYSE